MRGFTAVAEECVSREFEVRGCVDAAHRTTFGSPLHLVRTIMWTADFERGRQTAGIMEKRDHGLS